MNKKDILIVTALEQETQGLLKDFDLLYTGVGKINATYKLTEFLNDYSRVDQLVFKKQYVQPELVINYGTAGSRELSIGSIVIPHG